jgi:peptidoglycan/LPS O-acetylase OafA/YrhL
MRHGTTVHRPQLDALRGIAVIAVLIHHFLPVDRLIPSDFFTLGLLAVRLFFVLSGYLITGILLRSRRLSFRDALGRFYFRRALRIFPIYYIALTAAAVFNAPFVREFFAWHLLYLSNVLSIIHPTMLGPTGHLWTLSVEEQFYFVWPFVILLVPYRHLLKVVLGIIAAGVAWKMLVAAMLGDNLLGAIVTPACLDSLGIGAFLAFVESDANLRGRIDDILRLFWMAGIAIVCAQSVVLFTHRGMRIFWSPTQYFGVSLLFAWIIARAAEGFSGGLGALLETKPLLYLGKISYGIYLYHLFVLFLVRFLFRSRGIVPGTLATFVTASGLTLAIATVSWHVIERPISRWKESR